MQMEREVTGWGGSYVVHILVNVVLIDKDGECYKKNEMWKSCNERESCNKRAGREHRQNNRHNSTHTNLLEVSSNVIKQAQA